MVLYQQVATRRCDLLVPRSTQDATLGTLEAQNQALEAKLDRVLGAVAV